MAGFIAAKMCEALDYAHKKKGPDGHPLGIIHRDVSPQNVLVSYEGEVKVIDFGIAKAASRSTKTQAGVLKGKFGYMSPEQVSGLPLDRRSDVFAIGTILYEMITADRLFIAESDFATLEKVRNVDVAATRRGRAHLPPRAGPHHPQGALQGGGGALPVGRRDGGRPPVLAGVAAAGVQRARAVGLDAGALRRRDEARGAGARGAAGRGAGPHPGRERHTGGRGRVGVSGIHGPGGAGRRWESGGGPPRHAGDQGRGRGLGRAGRRRRHR